MNFKFQKVSVFWILAVIVVLSLSFYAFYAVGVQAGRRMYNFEDWQIDVDTEYCTALIQTDFGLDWVYDFEPGYFGE